MKLPKNAKLIKGARDYITPNGDVYTYRSNYRGIKTDMVIKKSQTTCWGYKYCAIKYIGETKLKSKRVHRLVAETFIPNPEGLPVVGHRNNIKSDNRVENLYWTTYSENTQKAVDDGLLVNDKGADDSQSKPVIMFDTFTNKVLGKYDSIKDAVRETGLPMTTISRQSRYKRPTRKPYYFRFADDKDAINNYSLVGMFDYDTDNLIETFINKSSAAKKTGLNERTIGQQCLKGKPRYKRSNVYFGYVSSKCEQTIESDKQVE